MVLNTPKSVLRHRPINRGTIPLQQGVPPRTRASQPWRADDQNALDLPLRPSARRPWAGDRPADNGSVRQERTWTTTKQPTRADVAVGEDDAVEELLVVPAKRQATRPAARPAPRTQEVVQEEELESYTPPATQRLNGEGAEYEEEEYEKEPTPMTYTGRPRYVAPRRTTTQQYSLQPAASSAPRTRGLATAQVRYPRSRSRSHWLLPLGGAMLLLIVLYGVGFTAFVWGLDRYNDWTYGITRTSHFEGVVGDHDSLARPTHFVALNLHGKLDIVEFPGGDPTRAKVYPGPQLFWTNAQKSVVTLQAKDVNHDGKPDLLVSVTGDPVLLSNTPTFNYVLLNTGNGFKPMIQQQQ